MLVCFSANATKKIAITLDDLPTLSHRIIDAKEQNAYFRRILKILDKYSVQATGFAVGRLITDENYVLLDNFIEKGHIIGNHTANHYDLNQVSCQKYIDDILLNESVIEKYMPEKKYFRYPMLHRGNTEVKRDSIYQLLDENDYLPAPVTIDTDEADYNIRFVKAYFSDQKDDAKKIGEEYVEHIISQSKYFDKLGYDITGRQIRHILLLHMNFT